MQQSPLGTSGLSVTRACLGTMTWGNQNNEVEAHAQLDYALDRGINIIDTAEMYPIPPNADTCHSTETYLGNWFAGESSRRQAFVLMTKMTGAGLRHIRDGAGLQAGDVAAAIDGSLQRLQTDVIDVYQLHWPNRANPHFNRHLPGAIDFGTVNRDQEISGLTGMIEALALAMKAGKIRYYGLSNESPWGLSTFLRLATEAGLPAPVSVQNEFNLLHAKDWPYLAEMCALENIAYFPWSPLAGGALSGKYLKGTPPGTRWSLNNRHGNFRDTPAVAEAIAAYCDVAARYGLTPAQLALGWVNQFGWVTSTILGATSVAQLQEDIDVFDQALPAEAVKDVNAVFRRYPVPF